MATVGNSNCQACVAHPSHRLEPCNHTICIDHVRIASNNITPDAPLCGFCHQRITGLAGFSQPGLFSGPSQAPADRHFAHTRPEFAPQTPGRLHSGFLPMTGSGHPLTHGAGSSSSSFAPLYSPSEYESTPQGTTTYQFDPRPTALGNPAACQTGHPTQQSNLHSAPSHHVETGAGRSASLAALIKAGGISNAHAFPAGDEVLPARPKHHNNNNNNNNNTDTFNSPVVRHWGSHLVEAVPDPPFLDAVLFGNGEMPDLESAIDHLPFINPTKHIKLPDVGVIKVSNIPYTATKPEIIAAIGRSARIISQPPGSPFYAIHIIMDRSSAKTMDCYVEVENQDEARNVIGNFKQRRERGRAPRVGERHVDIQLSDVPTLMAKLFPRANSIQWWGAIPVPYKPAEAYNSGFRGFITVEECSQMVKHADNPKSSPFMTRALNRSFEAMISMLYRYPWYKPELIAMGERALLFKTTVQMLRILIKNVSTSVQPLQLTPLLLQELICASLTVPFSHKQKNDIVRVVELAGYGGLIRSIGYDLAIEFSSFWPFEVLDKKSGVRIEVVKFYASLFKQAANSPTKSDSTTHDMMQSTSNPFGSLVVHYPQELRKMNLAGVADAEWDTVIRTLRSALKKQHAVALLDPDGIGFRKTPLGPLRSDSNARSILSTDICPATSGAAIGGGVSLTGRTTSALHPIQRPPPQRSISGCSSSSNGELGADPETGSPVLPSLKRGKPTWSQSTHSSTIRSPALVHDGASFLFSEPAKGALRLGRLQERQQGTVHLADPPAAHSSLGHLGFLGGVPLKASLGQPSRPASRPSAATISPFNPGATPFNSPKDASHGERNQEITSADPNKMSFAQIAARSGIKVEDGSEAAKSKKC